MPQIFLLIILVFNTFMGRLAMGNDQFDSRIPYPAPSYLPRKFGISPEAVKNVHSTSEESSRSLDNKAVSDSESPSEQVNEENVRLEGQEIHLGGHHRSVDKSVAGGGVILGSLATTFLVAIFCYIRATRRHKAESEITTTTTP